MYYIIYYELIYLFLFTEIILILCILGYYKLGLACLGTQWVNITEREMDQSQFFFCRAFGSSNEGLCNSSECDMNLTLTGVLANHISMSWGRDHFTASSGHDCV